MSTALTSGKGAYDRALVAAFGLLALPSPPPSQSSALVPASVEEREGGGQPLLLPAAGGAGAQEGKLDVEAPVPLLRGWQGEELLAGLLAWEPGERLTAADAAALFAAGNDSSSGVREEL